MSRTVITLGLVLTFTTGLAAQEKKDTPPPIELGPLNLPVGGVEAALPNRNGPAFRPLFVGWTHDNQMVRHYTAQTGLQKPNPLDLVLARKLIQAMVAMDGVINPAEVKIEDGKITGTVKLDGKTDLMVRYIKKTETGWEVRFDRPVTQKEIDIMGIMVQAVTDQKYAGTWLGDNADRAVYKAK